MCLDSIHNSKCYSTTHFNIKDVCTILNLSEFYNNFTSHIDKKEKKTNYEKEHGNPKKKSSITLCSSSKLLS